jgi:hypothetical protein
VANDLFQNTGWKKPWFDHLHKNNPVLIILMDIIKVEYSLKIGVIICICKPDDRLWSEAKIETPEKLCYMGWSFLMSWEGRDCFPKIHASTYHNCNAILLIS